MSKQTDEKNNKNILCVDDEEATSLLIRRALEIKGFTVTTVEDAEKGIKLVKRNPNLFAAILIDHDLGQGNITGIEAVVRLKKITRTPLIMVTGREDQEVVMAALNAGANYFITKSDGYLESLSLRICAVVNTYNESNIDPVTGFYMYWLFEDFLNLSIKQADKNKQMLAVILINVSKDEDDNLKHGYKDLLMAEVAARIRKAIGTSNEFFRTGDFEISIILSGIESKEAGAEAAIRIMHSFCGVFILRKEAHSIDLAVHISIYPYHGVIAKELLAMAQRIYSEKSCENMEASEYDKYFFGEMNSAAGDIEALRKAAKSKEMAPYFRSVLGLNCSDQENRRMPVGIEVLMAWKYKTKILLPEEYRKLGGNSRLAMVLISIFGLETGCKAIKELRGDNHALINILKASLSLTYQDFRGEIKLPGYIKLSLESVGLDPQYLNLEIEEEVVDKDEKKITQIMNMIKKMGVSWSVVIGRRPDFLRLQRLPISAIKISQEFIHDITTNEKSYAVTKGIIIMAKGLRLKVIAEGVEDEKQLIMLNTLGCDEVLSNIICPPMLFNELVNYLKGMKNRSFKL
jgi:diguanylate cyclase (GGDEF)-like protein